MKILFKVLIAFIVTLALSLAVLFGITKLTDGLVPDNNLEKVAYEIPDAGALAAAEIPKLCDLLKDEKVVAKAQKVIAKCTSCHSLKKGEPNKTGPNLYNLFGRTVGTVSGFSYSSSMKEKGTQGEVWDMEKLYAYLTNPKDYAANTKMTFRLPKVKDRASAVAYLRENADVPLPVPDCAPEEEVQNQETQDQGAQNQGDGAPQQDEGVVTSPLASTPDVEAGVQNDAAVSDETTITPNKTGIETQVSGDQKEAVQDHDAPKP